MAGAKIIKQLMIEREISVKTLADRLGINAQSMSNKLYRDSFSLEEYLIITDILNCDVKTITRDTGKEYK